MGRRGACVLLGLALAALPLGCTPTRTDVAGVSAGHRHPRLQRAIAAARAAGPAQGAAHRGGILDQGMALLKARMPHDLRRTDVPRWLSARRLFGDVLTRYAAAHERGDAAAAHAELGPLEDALQGWSDAANGQAAETAI